MACQLRMVPMLMLLWAPLQTVFNGLYNGRPVYTGRRVQPVMWGGVHWLIAHVICVHALLQ